MELRLGGVEDLPQLKELYLKLVEKMNEQGIDIWDDIYPSEFLIEDIKKNNLYILLEGNTIVGAYALWPDHNGKEAVGWDAISGKAFYVDRLAVNVDYGNKGIATRLLKSAGEIAKENKGEYLRLFVVDSNIPAINLYKKLGFKQAEGIYIEVIDDTLSFNEYGYEIRL